MNTNLDIVIAELEKTAKMLVQEKEACLKDFDYLGAHEFSLAARKIGRQLNVLRHLKNRNHWVIGATKRMIKNYASMYEKRPSSNTYERLKYEKEKLEQLEKEAAKNRLDTHVLQDLFYELLENKINRFTLILEERRQIKLIAKIQDSSLILSMPIPPFINNRPVFRNENTIPLQQIGFINKGEFFELTILDFQENKILKIIEILSRIIYDAFHFQDLDKPLKVIVD